jgi:hypothetical protein
MSKYSPNSQSKVTTVTRRIMLSSLWPLMR